MLPLFGIASMNVACQQMVSCFLYIFVSDNSLNLDFINILLVIWTVLRWAL